MRIYRRGEHTDFKYAKGNVDVYGRTFHSDHEIFLLLDGEAEYVSAHTRQILKPFYLVVIPPGEYHQFKICGDAKNYERCVMNIEANAFETDVLNRVACSEKIFALSRNHRIIQNFMYLIESLTSMEEVDFPHILKAVSMDIAVSLKYCKGEAEPSVDRLSDLAIHTMQYIDEHFTESFDLNTLSKEMYCSVSLLWHEFKDNFGISIKKYILQKRMNQARNDLKNGEKAEAVSVKYGFSTYSAFYRAYKNYFGTAPSKTIK